jgi:murein DD-endopeptidase MepM/ murein hydrolase activator NlpD
MRSRALLVAVPVWLLIGVLTGVPPAAARAAGGAPGHWVWPLAGARAVARPFDPPTTPYGRGHRGVDLPGRVGQDVRAAGAGRISYAGLLAGRGVVVVVHGDLRTTYEPVLAAVRVGQLVAAGAVIGRLEPGHAGCSGACLHWGLLRGDVYLDPVRLVRAGPSRLLPLDQAVAGADAAPASAVPPSSQPVASEPIRPAGDPAFALRSADARLGAAALLALLFGVALLRRPGGPPDDPAAPAAAGRPGGRAAEVPDACPDAGLVDLTSERERRRPKIA